MCVSVCVSVSESHLLVLCVFLETGCVCVAVVCVVCVQIVLYLMLYFNTTQPRAKGNIFISFLFLAIANCRRLVYVSEKNFLSTAFQ